ncbi:GNAT family N-acetyltransferase [Cellulomonas sp. URHD0024]|uniref:GNAT family N-acetyltransferase n=1 Tax=Cellulomonas sp. URHD0024 TaxID=1302620 RepID=UPI000428D733|nr:GNAT family N-acetyltransferase [Cellulomonas sp. URHD0024]
MTEQESSTFTITALTADHWPDVERIYAAGIATGHATFEAEPPTWEAFDAGKLPDHRLVALDEHRRVVGWAAAAAVSDRCAYSGVVEHSVYVDPSAQGRGVGRALLQALAANAESRGFWTVQSGIFPENRSSLAVHAAAGFRVVGTRERLGRMTYGPLAGQWRDVILVEKRL